MMQPIPSAQFIATIGAVTAALIAGFFSYINLISAKEQKISEFRQAWIDDLRDAICKYISSLSYLATLFKVNAEMQAGKKQRFEMLESVRELYERVNESYNSIILRVNDKETDEVGKKINGEFLNVLNDSREKFNNNRLEEARATTFSLREVAKPLLKHEWERVKTGEPTYRKAKKVAGWALVSGLVIALLGGGSVAYRTFAGCDKPEEKNPATAVSPAFKPNTTVHSDAAKKLPRR